MPFKLDENLPVEAAELLRNAGQDALTIADQQLSGAVDSQVAQVCRDEQRALITLDLDFADIRAYPPAHYHGIVVLRANTNSKRVVLGLIQKLIPYLQTETLTGKLWILQSNGLRIRDG